MSQVWLGISNELLWSTGVESCWVTRLNSGEFRYDCVEFGVAEFAIVGAGDKLVGGLPPASWMRGRPLTGWGGWWLAC